MLKRLSVFCFTLIAVLLAFTSQAQQNSSATNIRFRADAATRKVVIQYDLPTVQADDSLYVEFETNSGRVIRPLTVNGDVGKGLKAGMNKTVAWDVVKDGIPLNEEVRAVIRLVRPLRPTVAATMPTSKQSPPTTAPPTSQTTTKPATYPVVEHKKRSIVPIIGYVATGGLAIYGAVLASSINKDVNEYNSVDLIEPGDVQKYADLKSSVDSKKGTFTIVVGAAAALAVANVIYQIVSKPKPGRTAFSISPASQSMGMGITYHFRK